MTFSPASKMPFCYAIFIIILLEIVDGPYLGSANRLTLVIVLGNSTLSYIDVPDFLQPLGEKQLHALDAMIPSIKSLPIALIEGWPAYDQTTGEVYPSSSLFIGCPCSCSFVQYTWSWARFRGPSDAQWTFISSSLDDQGNLSTGFLPKLYRPWIGSENNVIFQVGAFISFFIVLFRHCILNFTIDRLGFPPAELLVR